jgi:hypothetical protein
MSVFLIAVPVPEHKKPTDYVSGLFRLDVTHRPRVTVSTTATSQTTAVTMTTTTTAAATTTTTKLRSTTTAITTSSDVSALTSAENASSEVRLGIRTFFMRLMWMQYCYEG